MSKHEFELKDLIDICSILSWCGKHRLANIVSEAMNKSERFQPKPPTVEISLEDAKLIADSVRLRSEYIQPYKNLKEAISKAEGKDRDSSFPVDFDKNMRTQKELPIQDQTNALRTAQNTMWEEHCFLDERVTRVQKETLSLKDTISQLQRVIESMKGESK